MTTVWGFWGGGGLEKKVNNPGFYGATQNHPKQKATPTFSLYEEKSCGEFFSWL